MRRSTAARRLALAALALLAAAGAARPYQYASSGPNPIRWPGAQATIFTDGVMTLDKEQAMRAAAVTWSQVPNSAFRYVYGGTTSSIDVRDHANGNSDLYFDSTLSPLNYAVTYTATSGAAIVEGDVAFNGSMTWATSGSPPGAPDVQTVALHELGHVLGLLHEDVQPSVMISSADASIPRRTLFTDDEDGARFLYPAGGGGGGGGPKGPDLAAGTLVVTSGTAGAGNGLNLRAEVKNRSPSPAGPFRVKAVLVTELPAKSSDAEVGTTDVLLLPGSTTVTVDIDTFIPASTPPGKWHLGVYVDPENAMLDPFRANNAAAGVPFTVSAPPAALLLGDTMDAGMGPLGKDGGAAWIGAGTEVSVKVRGQRGVKPSVRILDGPGGAVLAEGGTGRGSVSLRWTAPEDGTYSFEVANLRSTVGRFTLVSAGRTRLRKFPATAPDLVPFAAYAGGTVRIAGLFEGAASPLACRPPSGPDVTQPGSVNGRRALLSLIPGETGIHSLVLDGEGGVLLTLDSRTPRPGGLFVR